MSVDRETGLVIDPDTNQPIIFPDDSFKKVREIDELREQVDWQKKQIGVLNRQLNSFAVPLPVRRPVGRVLSQA